MSGPTKKDLAEFAAYCRTATDNQLRNIEERELAARRKYYADIAREEIQRRARP